MCVGPTFLGNSPPPEFFDLHYLTGADDDHVAKFHGDRPRKVGVPMAKEKTPRVKHKDFRNYAFRAA